MEWKEGDVSMPRTLLLLRVIEVVVGINTVIFSCGIVCAIRGRIALHKKLNLFAFITTMLGVVGLVVSLLLGWEYHSLTTPSRMLIHRSFSTPLLVTLCLSAYFGIRGDHRNHLRWIKPTIPLWLGTFITAVWFF